jgi:glutathione peroxidase
MQNTLLFSLIIFFASCFNKTEISHRPATISTMNVAETSNNTQSFYNFSAKTLDGETIAFEQYKGKKIIILNVASECGYTPQYADWEKFYKDNKDNTVVLGFPCNQFMGQEPGDNKQIKAFCEKNYGVTFPIFEKVDVKGDNKSDIYKWLTDKTQNGWNEKEPSWNFCKYLINEKGELVEFFASAIKPENAEFRKALNP